MSPRESLLAIAVAIVWGLNFVAMRWGVAEVPPLLLTGLRYFFAAVPAVFFIPRPAIGLGRLVLYGFAIGVCQFGLLFLALGLGMPAGLASIVMQLQAFFTVALAVLLFGERLDAPRIAGMAVGFAGIAVIAIERMGSTALVPLLLTIAAALFWGFGNIIGKGAGKADMLSVVVWSSLVPPLPMLALSLIFEGPGAIPQALGAISWRGIGSLAFMAYGATIFGYAVWGKLLLRHPAGEVSPYALLIPVAGMAGGALLLGETISTIEITGSALVFAGLAINAYAAWRAKAPPTARLAP